MSATLDQIFAHQIGEAAGDVHPYSDLLAWVVDGSPYCNVKLESQQWSKLAAIQQGNCTIHEPSDLTGDTVPWDSDEVAVQVTYYWDRDAGQYDLAWVATWPYDEA